MSKELDSVELARIEFEKDLEDDPNNEWLKRVIKGLKMAEHSLQRLEKIDNAKPSEALECLERIDNTLCLNNIKGKLEFGIDTEEHNDCDSVIGMTEDLETIKNHILKTQEQEKVLEIIKEKFVDIYLLKSINTLEEYNKNIGLRGIELTQEEFDTLKEWQNNDNR